MNPFTKIRNNFFGNHAAEVWSGSFASSSWKKLTSNKFALAALVWIGICLAVSGLGYLITPDGSPMANSQHLELAVKKPGTSIDFIRLSEVPALPRVSFLKKVFYGERDKSQWVALESYAMRGDTVFFERIGGQAETESVSSGSGAGQGQIVRKTFWLGTDQFGRDVLSRLIIGARVSLAIGFVSVMISLIIGVFIGSLGGFFRGKTDAVVMWLINVVWSIPTLLLVIAVTFALGKGFWQIFVAVGLTMWVEVARVTRGQILEIREKEYVEAARALGFSDARIIFRHILPNITGPLIVISAANFASAILIEAGLSFLGIGVQPPMPSWGGMIRENYHYLLLDSPHLAILPGLAIMMLVLAFMVLGNGLRDALDVRSSGAGEKGQSL